MRSYKKSAELLERAKKSLAGGVSSEFRKYNHPHAIFYSHGKGSRIYDVDGNEYLDFTLSQGPLITGHNHPHVMQRVAEYSQYGQLYAGQHILEVELAEKMQTIIPSAEMMRFCLDGSEAVQTAFRLARAKTGKTKFLRFEGHYHGWLDNVAWGISGPSVEALGPYDKPTAHAWSAGMSAHTRDEFILIPWNNTELLIKTVETFKDELAAIITEPIMCNNGCILPKEGFLQTIRELCDMHNITCIFDEVITGFRASLSGAQGHFDLVPDLSIFAKAMASGYPISAIVGKKEWMQWIEQGKVIHAGTMNASNATVAAALGTIEVLETHGTYEKIYNLGQMLMQGLKELGQKYHLPLLVQGLGPMFHTGFTSQNAVNDFRDVQQYDKALLGRFVAEMHDQGIRIIGRGLWYISTEHTEADILHTLTVADSVLAQLKQ
jgi:glutamate-1-semialdehyde 2,1-aminomutase